MNGLTRESIVQRLCRQDARNALALGLGILAIAPAANAQCTLTGAGTTASPFLVSKYVDLVQVGLPCGMTATYKLTADIDTVGQAGRPFAPIGTDPDTTVAFSGTFLGGGFSIKNLVIKDTLNLDVGLFSEINGGTVDSVTLWNTNIYGKVSNVGGIAGFNKGTIKACYVLGVVNGGRNGVVGGIVGENDGTVLRSHSLVLTNSETGSYVGGIAGMNDTDAVVRNCYASGSILSKVYNNVLGGVVGLNAGTVAGSYSTGKVNGGSVSIVGGVVGENQDLVDSCWATGSGRVYSTSESQIGGVVGLNDSTSIVNKSYADVPVVCDYYCKVGGVVGENNGSVLSSHATDSVMGGTNSLVGGVAGQNGIKCVINYSYSLGRVVTVDSASVGGIVGENSGLVKGSYGSGSMTGRYSSRIGGVAGTNEVSGSISDVYAVGTIGCGVLSTMGGLLAENRGEIVRAYAATSVAGRVDSGLGGAIGMNGPGGKMRSVFWNSALSQIEMGVGSDVQGGMNGVPGNLNTTLMHDSTNFRGFDFLNVWSISQGAAYPNLRGLVNSPMVPVESRSQRIANFASMRRVGSQLELDLPVAGEIRILDLQGRQILAAQRIEAGRRSLTLPNGSAAVVAQIRSAGRTTSRIVEPVR